jgi:hypothetical protein
MIECLGITPTDSLLLSSQRMALLGSTDWCSDFIGTLNTSVETSASEKAATDTPRIEVAYVFRLAKTIAKTRQEGIRIGITLPKGTNQSLLDAHVVFLRKLTDDRMNKRVRPEFRARRKPSDS